MKRSNGEGTIFKRKDGRWCAAFYDDSPKPKRHFVYGTSQKEVKEKLKLKREDVAMQSPNNNSDTLEEWMINYLENFKRNEVKETTYSAYLELYLKHIKGTTLGKTKLYRITGNQLQKYYNEKSEQGYSAKTVKHMYILINSALKKAVQLKFINENFNDLVVLPKKEEYHAKTLSVDEVNRILNEAKEEELYPLIILTLYTGLRKGEVMALKWSDIDFQNKELSVNGSLGRVMSGIDEKGKKKYSYKILPPKTQKSKRIIPLTENALKALECQKSRQEMIKEKYSSIYRDEGFVFARYDGSYLNQRGFMDDYHAFLRKYHITDIRFHDLRHTFASLLLEAGESPKAIQELLGHSTITTTMDIYTHITKKGKIKAIEKLDGILI